jgi:hypothetical protein
LQFKILVAVLAVVPARVLAADGTLLVSPDRLSCLVANYDKYLATDDDPILIFLDACPRVQPTKAELMASASNSVPSVKEKDPASTTADSIIALRKSELKCLAEGIKSGIIAPSPAKDSAGQDVVRLSLTAC